MNRIPILTAVIITMALSCHKSVVETEQDSGTDASKHFPSDDKSGMDTDIDTDGDSDSDIDADADVDTDMDADADSDTDASHIYEWHTFMGSGHINNSDFISADSSGNIYITGTSYGTWYGPSGQSPLNPHSGLDDFLILKLGSDGAYQWHTLLGSATGDMGISSTTDSGNNIYVTGWSDSTWKGPGNSRPIHAFSENSTNADACVIKLHSDGTYNWHTFMGSAANDFGYGIATDSDNNIYITGDSGGSWNGPGDAGPLNAHSGYRDVVVIKLDSNGAYEWHTFMGSDHGDIGIGIALDGDNNIYLTGGSDATWNGPDGSKPLNDHAGGFYPEDIVIIKLDSSGAYEWHTFMGSTESDIGRYIAIDTGNNIYLTGSSDASWNGPSGQSPLNEHSGLSDITIIKVNSNGAYEWHTFMGSTGMDSDDGIVIDSGNNIYVTGWSSAAWTGPGDIRPLSPYSGDCDTTVIRLDSNGNYDWHTFMGSASDTDYSQGITMDSSDSIYVCGNSGDQWNGPGGAEPLHPHTGSPVEIFILKMSQY